VRIAAALLVAGVSLGAWAQSPAGFCLASANGIACDSGALRLDWASKTLLESAFPNGAGTWQTENFENALTFDRQQEAGVFYLSVRRNGQKCDTAFSVSSRAFDVAPGTFYELRIDARGDPAFARPRGHRNSYWMRLQWLGADGQPAGTQPFGLDCKENAWQETRVTGSVPAGAASAVISIAADTPNIVSGRPLDIRHVIFSAQTPGEHRAAGEAVSRPLPAATPPAELRWQATCPPGTRMAVQVSSAPDDNGAPGAWSSFVGPDGSAASAFEESGQRLPPLPAAARWLRYRVRLTSDSPARSPVVRQLLIGPAEDGPWSAVDRTPPVLENLSPARTGNAQAPVRFRLSDATSLNASSLRFWVDGHEETARLQRRNGEFLFAPEKAFVPLGKARDAADVPPNLHFFRVVVEDQAANRLDTTWPLLIGGQGARHRVTLRDDGAVLVDREPFFPIGIYAVWKKEFNSNSFDRAFAELKANGFNLAHTYQSGRTADFRDFMDAAARHGLRLFLASGQGANGTDVREVLGDVARERSHPAVLAWYLADDTAMHVMPRQLSELTEAIRAIDPDHLTVQADGVGEPPASNYSGFVGATDGFLPELYPIRENEGVPQIITDMQTLRADIQAAGNPVKTVWPIIQYFEGWGWPRFPTADELRAMSFLALIHGANGITWYTYGGHGQNHGATHTAETWGTLCRVAKEISGLQTVLLSETRPAPHATIVAGPQKDSQGHRAISLMEKRCQGKRYLLCANSAQAEVKVAIALPDAKRVADRQDPSHAPTFAQGVMTDTFPPYGVRVYVAE